MERSIGMDVHAASCPLAVISEKGRKLRDFPAETHGQALVEAVRVIPGHKPRVLEEGLQTGGKVPSPLPRFALSDVAPRDRYDSQSLRLGRS